MDMFAWFSLISYGLAFLIVVTFAIAYLSRSEFMPYHSVAIARPWSEVDSRMQLLLLALIKVVGSASVALALGGFFQLYLLFSRNWGLLHLIIFQLFCLIAVAPPVVIAIYVRHKTRASTPILSGCSVVFLTLSGFTFAVLSGRYA